MPVFKNAHMRRHVEKKSGLAYRYMQHFDETAAAIAFGCVKVTTNSRHTQVKRLYGHHVERRHLPKEFVYQKIMQISFYSFFSHSTKCLQMQNAKMPWMLFDVENNRRIKEPQF